MAPPSETAPDAPVEAPIEGVPPPPRQRWRLILARSADAPDLGSREAVDAWEAALEASGLPLFRAPGRARPRIAFGAPIPAKIELERELADVVLTDLVATWHVREALSERVPAGWQLIEVQDVWLGSPPLAGLVVAAAYRIAVTGADATVLATAARRLLDASELPRDRLKGGSTVRYDLRPLLSDVQVVTPGPPVVVRARTRFDPALGTGRPEEVVAALGDAVGSPLVVASLARERLILADDVA